MKFDSGRCDGRCFSVGTCSPNLDTDVIQCGFGKRCSKDRLCFASSCKINDLKTGKCTSFSDCLEGGPKLNGKRANGRAYHSCVRIMLYLHLITLSNLMHQFLRGTSGLCDGNCRSDGNCSPTGNSALLQCGRGNKTCIKQMNAKYAYCRSRESVQLIL